MGIGKAAHAGIFPQRQQGNQAGKQRPQGIACIKQHAQHQRQQNQGGDDALFQHNGLFSPLLRARQLFGCAAEAALAGLERSNGGIDGGIVEIRP